MRSFIYRNFHTKINVLNGFKNSGLLIQTVPDIQNKEQNRAQFKTMIEGYNFRSEYILMAACADTVFMNILGNGKLCLAGDPHICGGIFDKNLRLVPNAFISKAIGSVSVKKDFQYGVFTVANQDFTCKAAYHSAAIAESHFFEMANKVVVSNSIFSNGKNSNPIINAGGGFYEIGRAHV